MCYTKKFKSLKKKPKDIHSNYHNRYKLTYSNLNKNMKSSWTWNDSYETLPKERHQQIFEFFKESKHFDRIPKNAQEAP